jgi:hypothetical protein
VSVKNGVSSSDNHRKHVTTNVVYPVNYATGYVPFLAFLARMEPAQSMAKPVCIKLSERIDVGLGGKWMLREWNMTNT